MYRYRGNGTKKKSYSAQRWPVAWFDQILH